MAETLPKLRFEKAGYYFIGLVLITLLGFWPSYFSHFFTGEVLKVQKAKEPFFFHLHAVLMSLWILALIVQPILIRQKKLAIHRIIGKASYVVMPLLIASVILLVHSRNRGLVDDPTLGVYLYVPFKDVIIVSLAFAIAVWKRHDVNIHARAMIVTGIQFIEPPLVRFIGYAITRNHTYFYTIGTIYMIYLTLIFLERKQTRGRWVFPLFLGLTIVLHILVIFDIQIPIWESFAKWFVSLPLT